MLRELLERDTAFEFTPAPMADPQTISLAHDPAYVGAFVDGKLEASALRRIGFPWSQELVERTLASAGGTLAATEDALKRGWGGTLAGGTYHALYAEGAGFCVFNDIAIAIRKLQGAARIQRAAVVDLDVHQGDGTAAIFHGDPDVFTFSMHGAANFPFRKQDSRLDIGLPDGTGDEEYLGHLTAALAQVLDFGPDIVYYQSGVDALTSDRMGRLSLTAEGLLDRDRMVLEACRTSGIPVVITLGGGYAEPIELTVAAHANTFRLAGSLFCAGVNPKADRNKPFVTEI
jgi:acetoin utilization deacetylase AcuC-like enzyme